MGLSMERVFYYAQIIDGLNTLFSFVCGACGIAAIYLSVAAFVIYYDANDQESLIKCKSLRRWAIRVWSILAVAIVGIIFIPTKQTFLFMVGGHAVDSMIERHPGIKDIPGNTLDLLNEYIKAETEKIRRKQDE